MKTTLCDRLLISLMVLSACGSVVAADDKPVELLKPTEYLVIGSVAGGGRGAGRGTIVADPVAAKIVSGDWSIPNEGDTLESTTGGEPHKWSTMKVAADGSISGPELRGGYALWTINAPKARIMILEAAGDEMVYVNGEPRAGDPYSHGYVHLPIKLEKGKNQLLFRVARGRLQAQLVAAPRAGAKIDLSDSTLPDVIVAEDQPLLGAVIVANTSEEAGDFFIKTRSKHIQISPPFGVRIPPLSMRKVPFTFDAGQLASEGSIDIGLDLIKNPPSLESINSATLSLRVRRPDQTHKRTFISEIDGSVQYYAVNPASVRDAKSLNAAEKPALFLTLHGAAVEAMGQADAYSSKTWGHLIAPTNRRPYGFDWEDWGRLDAIEVLELAAQKYHTDPARVYLTGHSMGGHGTWHLGATFPDKFAAIGPSAGWISFSSYAGAIRPENPDALQQMLIRSQSASDTIALLPNYAQEGVYILHGGADDNVPADQAREMNKRLAEFHHDFQYHEQAGAGHWWDSSDEPGADCVDWAPMFDFFARHIRPGDERIRRVSFGTASPRVSNRSQWASIEAQVHPLQISSIDIQYDPGQRRFQGKTTNVARLAFDLSHVPPGRPLHVELDGRKLDEIAWPSDEVMLWITREGKDWKRTSEPSAALKGPLRYGPFKDAFRNRVVLVYGTTGNAEENRWSRSKARFDAESFWYRGNASIDLISDREFRRLDDLSHGPVIYGPDVNVDTIVEFADRNMIIYGNADTNSAWKELFADSDVEVRRGSVKVGERTLTGDDLGVLFLKPRPGSETAVVGVVSGSGMKGFRLTDRLPYVVSGTGYPDCLVLSSEVMTKGALGLRVAGFFGLDWMVKSGEFAWREKAEDAQK